MSAKHAQLDLGNVEPRTPPGQIGTSEQQQFDYFGRLRKANLVTTDEGKAHYWVAMEGGDVYLTKLGRYFWKRAKRGVL